MPATHSLTPFSPQLPARLEAEEPDADQEAAQGGALPSPGPRAPRRAGLAAALPGRVLLRAQHAHPPPHLQKKVAPQGEKPEAVRTHLRDMVIVPEMIGSVIGVYNGKTFNQVEIKVRTCLPQPCPACSLVLTLLTPCCVAPAGDGGHLHRRVQHHIQAREARPPWHRRHTLLPLHPPQVESRRRRTHAGCVSCDSREQQAHASHVCPPHTHFLPTAARVTAVHPQPQASPCVHALPQPRLVP